MKIQPQLYSMAPNLHGHLNPQAIEKNILTYSQRCLPVKKTKSAEKSFEKKEKDDPVHLNHTFRVYGVGQLINETI
tara:strand:- start:176 stop:403 length:228 start_codon:yes stop_codon:yes gene_type:complete